MLGNLERYREIELPRQLQRMAKIARQKPVPWNLQALLIDIFTIDSEDVGNPKLTKDSQPRSSSTSHVDNALRPRPFEHKWDDHACRAARADLQGIEEFARVWRVH